MCAIFAPQRVRWSARYTEYLLWGLFGEVPTVAWENLRTRGKNVRIRGKNVRDLEVNEAVASLLIEHGLPHLLDVVVHAVPPPLV